MLHPVFFVVYRLSAFGTVPHDDYAPYLLYLLNRGGFLVDSPYCYRVLSILAAAPFFYLLPAIPLTNLPHALESETLRATAALTAVAYLAWIGAAQFAYAGARRAGIGRAEAALAACLLFALMPYVQITAIDPLALALIAAGVWQVRHRRGFAAILALSVFANEKVALVLAIWLVIRCALSRADRAEFWPQATAAVLAVLAYLAAVRLIHVPGNSYQLEPGYYPSTLRDNVMAYASMRGLLLNLLPIGVLAGLALIARPVGVFRRADMLVIPALACVALVLTQLFQAGRIVMHAAPIFVIPAAAGITSWLQPRSAEAG